MGGIAAVAGAAGPVIGGLLTATVGWQAVFLINVPLAAIAIAITLTAIPSDIHQANTAKIDVPGAVLLAVGITALIVGLSQSQNWGWDSLAVWGILLTAVAAAGAFIAVERRRDQPLVYLRLFGRSPNYRTAVISQSVSGAAELGLGVILPLLLILNLGMSPASLAWPCCRPACR
jgi:MFS family permease